MSRLTCSTLRLEWCARVISSQVRMRSTSAAWISMSLAWPPDPPEVAGWWIRIRAFGSARRMPGVPAAAMTAAAEAAWPSTTVEIGGGGGCLGVLLGALAGAGAHGGRGD